MNKKSEALSSLALMGLASIKQDTRTHHTNQSETNKLIDALSVQLKRIETNVERTEQSTIQLNLAITNLVNSQMQTNAKLDKLADNVEKLWRERWLYRIFPLTLFGLLGLGI